MLRMIVCLLAIVTAPALAGCDGSTVSTSTRVIHTTTTPPAPPAPPDRPAIAYGPVRATIRGQNHAPRVGRPWAYTLRVTAADGRPLSGTVDVRFAFGERLVGHDVPPAHPLHDGQLRESMTFPASAAGYPIALEAIIHTAAGSVTLFWPLTVKR